MARADSRAGNRQGFCGFCGFCGFVACAASAASASAAAVTATTGHVPDYLPMQAVLGDGFIDLASKYAAAVKESVTAEGLQGGCTHHPT
jgi:hypothetical protein